MTTVPPSQSMLPSHVQASVLFLAIRDAATLAADELARRREALRAVVETLLPRWRPDTRVVLEADEGMAIVSLTGPVRVLESADAIAANPELAIALHHGAVRMVELAGWTELTGDGVDTARAIAVRPGASAPAATREFRRALLAVDPARREWLRPAGDFLDERLRTHELFEVDPAAPRRRRNRRLVIGGAVVVGLLGMGTAVRLARQQYAAARRPAALLLDVRPSGELWVDGRMLGTTPPLTRVEVPPGPHMIEVRHGRLKPLALAIELKPGEELPLQHAFTLPAPLRRSGPAPSFWDRIKPW